MLQLSLDGKRLYVINSLYRVWDDQFYPDLGKNGAYLMQVDCDTQQAGLSVNDEFFVDFSREPQGAARAHEIRFPHLGNSRWQPRTIVTCARKGHVPCTRTVRRI